jgi:hypothetical protein
LIARRGEPARSARADEFDGAAGEQKTLGFTPVINEPAQALVITLVDRAACSADGKADVVGVAGMGTDHIGVQRVEAMHKPHVDQLFSAR